jgi:hypothetical protein
MFRKSFVKRTENIEVFTVVVVAVFQKLSSMTVSGAMLVFRKVHTIEGKGYTINVAEI